MAPRDPLRPRPPLELHDPLGPGGPPGPFDRPPDRDPLPPPGGPPGRDSPPLRAGSARGHTLLELATALLLLGTAGSLLHPLARGTADRLAVEGARERVVAVFDRARTEARTWGAAEVEIRAAGPVILLRRAAAEVARADLRPTGVELDAGADVVVIGFDALGLGRVASRTLVFRRGEERAELVVSGLGRVSRR